MRRELESIVAYLNSWPPARRVRAGGEFTEQAVAARRLKPREEIAFASFDGIGTLDGESRSRFYWPPHHGGLPCLTYSMNS